jgi:hypothetical protein
MARARSFSQSTVPIPLDRPRGPVAWPAGSPDLTSVVYILRSHIKSLVCAKRSNSTAELVKGVADVAGQVGNDRRMVMTAVGSTV